MQEGILDPVTDTVFRIVGVAGGWRCLEVGFGAGSVTRMLSTMVGQQRSVVGADLDGRFFDLCRADNVELVAGDVRQLPLAEGSFDLVHTRMTPIYFAADVEQVLGMLVRALKPGGWLVCEEADLTAAHRYAGDGSRWEKFVADSRAAMNAVGADFTMGDQLPYLFQQAGLVDVQTEAHTPTGPRAAPAPTHAYESLEFARPFLVQH